MVGGVYIHLRGEGEAVSQENCLYVTQNDIISSTKIEFQPLAGKQPDRAFMEKLW